MTDHDREMSRRVLLRGAALTGVTVPVLAACGSDGGGSTGGSDGSSGAAKATVATSDVPVGGGKILGDAQVVVTQPSKGEFKAFSAICTHQGCPVQSISDGTINCPCHGSQFSVEDGSVVHGPATTALPGLDVKVQGGEVEVS
jgi:Rieske Fe-S protein